MKYNAYYLPKLFPSNKLLSFLFNSWLGGGGGGNDFFFGGGERSNNKMVLEPNVSPHKQIIKDEDVKECISTE